MKITQLEKQNEECKNKNTIRKKYRLVKILEVSYVLRWILLFPLSFIISFSIQILLIEYLIYFVYFAGVKPKPYAEEVGIELSFVILGFFLVIIGIVIAPYFKKVTAYAMCGISFLLASSVILVVKDNGIPSTASLDILAGGLLGVVTFHEKRIIKGCLFSFFSRKYHCYNANKKL